MKSYSFCLMLFPLLLVADTIKVKTRAPQNLQAVFQYRVPRGYNPRKTCRVLVIFGGRNTDGKADAYGRMDWAVDWWKLSFLSNLKERWLQNLRCVLYWHTGTSINRRN